ncbi:hypothetical protein E1258_19830 [Micromonospora sp. KC207]|uniref:hypothetical protein n=1 Tax=Micromonospora sp. KC207 TaxID=2530377 RepID=UPI0010463D46|nr:hypothetical protein [Micromonospora sp. KC207]TDC58923.1 hypothetical protein E1258_19830 [Micromonospora sp. KC207]
MLVVVVVGCEIGFWVLLVAGLVARYPLRRPRLGAALLVCVPLVDLVLLAVTALDLRRGATADATHGLAAVYLGFSVAFGHSTIRWADQRFAHRFAGGPPPVRPPRHGWARARHEWREWAKGLLGWAVACAFLVAAIVYVGDAERTRELWDWVRTLTVGLVIWLIAFPVWETIFPRRPRR